MDQLLYLSVRLTAALDRGQALCDTHKDASGNAITCETGLPSPDAGTAQIHQVLSIVFGIAAALAVLFIVVSGLRFVLAQGNPQEVAKARSTIIYALIGLVIAIAAEAIVSLTLKTV